MINILIMAAEITDHDTHAGFSSKRVLRYVMICRAGSFAFLQCSIQWLEISYRDTVFIPA